MRLNKIIAIPALALTAGLSLAACGSVKAPAAAPAVTHAVTAPAAAPKPATPAPTTPAPAQTVYVQAPAAPAPAAPGPAYNNYPAGAFTDSQSLYDSLANEQQTELQAAPAYDYYSPGNITVHVWCNPDGSDTYSCTGSDTDGDTGYGDTVTVIDNGNGWTDTGMNWTGPDIYVNGGVTNYWTTPAQSDWSN